MSENSKPREGAWSDGTLRRTGARDLSDANSPGSPPLPPNPRMDILDPQIGGRSQVPQNDYQLHMGAPPERIDRLNSMRTNGLVGTVGQGTHADRSGEYMRVGHVPAYHEVKKPTSGIPDHGSADSLHIPAVQIGAPLP